MVGWHHQFNGHELGQTLEDSEGQRGLVCCSPWGHRVRHDFMTEQQQMGTLNLASLLTYSNKKISSQSPFPALSTHFQANGKPALLPSDSLSILCNESFPVPLVWYHWSYI